MFKTISKSSISKRKFQVYKLWNTSDSEYPVKLASTASVSEASQSLYHSLKSKYYSTNGNAFTTFGSVENLGQYTADRQIPNTFQIIPIDRIKFGEEIKPNSVALTFGSGDFIDDGYSNLIPIKNIYNLISIDLETGKLIINNGVEDFILDLIAMNFETGLTSITYQLNTNEFYLVEIDLELGTIEFTSRLIFNNRLIPFKKFGNVFYDEGLIVITSDILSSEYDLDYRSTQTIYETEVLITAKAGEFNYSQNPTAVEVTLSGSYDFETTAINNVEPAGSKKIKEVLDIKRKESFPSEYADGMVSGSWNDYYEFGSTDPTGSYLTTYVTTIGLYDENGDLLVIAKLPKPIKNLPDYDLNFLIRFDT